MPFERREELLKGSIGALLRSEEFRASIAALPMEDWREVAQKALFRDHINVVVKHIEKAGSSAPGTHRFVWQTPAGGPVIEQWFSPLKSGDDR